MRTIRMLSPLTLAGFVLSHRLIRQTLRAAVFAKKAAKEATKDAAGTPPKDTTKDAAAGAVEEAAAPDAVDLDAAAAEQ